MQILDAGAENKNRNYLMKCGLAQYIWKIHTAGINLSRMHNGNWVIKFISQCELSFNTIGW